jgi:hypothetical protein
MWSCAPRSIAGTLLLGGCLAIALSLPSCRRPDSSAPDPAPTLDQSAAGDVAPAPIDVPCTELSTIARGVLAGRVQEDLPRLMAVLERLASLADPDPATVRRLSMGDIVTADPSVFSRPVGDIINADFSIKESECTNVFRQPVTGSYHPTDAIHQLMLVLADASPTSPFIAIQLNLLGQPQQPARRDSYCDWVRLSLQDLDPTTGDASSLTLKLSLHGVDMVLHSGHAATPDHAPPVSLHAAEVWIDLLARLPSLVPDQGEAQPAPPAGLFLLDGRVLSPPYTVTRRGPELRVNDIPVLTRQPPVPPMSHGPEGDFWLLFLGWYREVGYDEAVRRGFAYLSAQPGIERVEQPNDSSFVVWSRGNPQPVTYMLTTVLSADDELKNWRDPAARLADLIQSQLDHGVAIMVHQGRLSELGKASTLLATIDSARASQLDREGCIRLVMDKCIPFRPVAELVVDDLRLAQ